MINSKLLQLFQVLSAEDLRQVQKMLKSPYFTTNENLQTLFSVLRKQHPDFSEKALEKERVFARVFPKYAYNELKLRNLMTELVKIIEQHLVLSQFEKKPELKGMLLSEYWLEDGRWDLVEKSLKQFQNNLDQAPYQDEHFFYMQYDFLRIKKKILRSIDPVTGANFIMDIRQSLHSFYQLSDLKLAIELKSISSFSKVPEHNSEVPDLANNITFQLYRDVSVLLEREDLNLFYAIKERLVQNLNQLSPIVKMEIFSLLLNFIVKQMDIDDRKFNSIAFQLYQSGITYDLFPHQTAIIESHFYNIVFIAAKEEEFEWATDFIASHQEYLNVNTKTDLLIISKACLYFYKKDYAHTIDFLLSHSFQISVFDNIARLHLIKSYYELFIQDRSYFDLLVAQTLSYEKFARRNKALSAMRKEAQVNFAQFVRKLAQSGRMEKISEKEKSKLRTKLSKDRKISSRSWLSDKLEKGC